MAITSEEKYFCTTRGKKVFFFKILLPSHLTFVPYNARHVPALHVRQCSLDGGPKQLRFSKEVSDSVYALAHLTREFLEGVSDR
jgi:hypothetical protein